MLKNSHGKKLIHEKLWKNWSFFDVRYCVQTCLGLYIFLLTFSSDSKLVKESAVLLPIFNVNKEFNVCTHISTFANFEAKRTRIGSKILKHI
jgi:hypothetical protein